jgi:UDP-N-acetylglucosamine acyltransferase
VIGHRGVLGGLNVIGLKRRGYGRADMHRLRAAYHELFFGEETLRQRRQDFDARYADDPLIGKIVVFLRESGSRPLMLPARSTRNISQADETA